MCVYVCVCVCVCCVYLIEPIIIKSVRWDLFIRSRLCKYISFALLRRMFFKNHFSPAFLLVHLQRYDALSGSFVYVNKYHGRSLAEDQLEVSLPNPNNPQPFAHSC